MPGHICAVVVTTLVLEGWSSKLDPSHSVMDQARFDIQGVLCIRALCSWAYVVKKEVAGSAGQAIAHVCLHNCTSVALHAIRC